MAVLIALAVVVVGGYIAVRRDEVPPQYDGAGTERSPMPPRAIDHLVRDERTGVPHGSAGQVRHVTDGIRAEVSP